MQNNRDDMERRIIMWCVAITAIAIVLGAAYIGHALDGAITEGVNQWLSPFLP